MTTLQIIQFMTSGLCFLGTLYMHNILDMRCKGMNVVYGSLVFNATLLYGFIGVLRNTRSGKKASKGE